MYLIIFNNSQDMGSAIQTKCIANVVKH